MQSEAVILGTFAVCVFLFLSNFHICGMLGDMFSSMLLGVFGSTVCRSEDNAPVPPTEHWSFYEDGCISLQ